MKKIVAAATVLLSVLSVAAQETAGEKFIEVMVQDTLSVEPDLIECIVLSPLPIHLGGEYEGDDEPKDELLLESQRVAAEKKDAQTDKALQQLFRKHKISYRKVDDPALRGVAGETWPRICYLLTFADLTKLAAFNAQVQQLEGLENRVFNKKSSKMALYEKQLIQRVVERAKAKASAIAQAAGKELLGIVQVKEIGDSSELQDIQSGWVVYPTLNVNGGGRYDTYSDGNRILLRQKMLVRFAIGN